MFKRTVCIVHVGICHSDFPSFGRAAHPGSDRRLLGDECAGSRDKRRASPGDQESCDRHGGYGKEDLFVGTWYRNSGPNTWLWAGYAPVAGGYQRITPGDSDVLIDFDGIYVGDLPDIGRPGMAQAYSLELDNKDRGESNMISDLTFYYIEDGKLMQQGTGALDRDDPEQESKFDYYFGPNRKTAATPKIESFTVPELVERGYHIPVWGSLKPLRIVSESSRFCPFQVVEAKAGAFLCRNKGWSLLVWRQRLEPSLTLDKYLKKTALSLCLREG